jgi:phosphoesterase RecJ-like protein
MYDEILAFLGRHQSFILCTHDPPDADGLGAEITFACILKTMGKHFRIINASPFSANFAFMDRERVIESWNKDDHDYLPEKSALLILDTSDEYNIGIMREILDRVREVFVLDHHEPTPQSALKGHIDSAAASTSELVVEIAVETKITPDENSARAAYAGIVYDSGFFGFIKTSRRTFTAALYLVERGVVPYQIYRELNESASTGALLLQKQVFSTMEIHGGKIAVQVLRKEYLEKTGANFEDAGGLINIPLKSMDIAVSILVKENTQAEVRLSLRSKGSVNVSKIAQAFGGGGHVSAAGFRCVQGIEEVMGNTLKQVIEKVEAQL